MSELDEDALQDIYTWIDDIPLTRPKKNIARDFSDGVLVAEIIHHFLPKLVDLHNYISVNSTNQKVDNWNLLARKCFNKLAYNPDVELIRAVTHCKTGAIETVLGELRTHIEAFIAKRKAKSFVAKNQIQDQFTDPQYLQENGERNDTNSVLLEHENIPTNTVNTFEAIKHTEETSEVTDIPPKYESKISDIPQKFETKESDISPTLDKDTAPIAKKESEFEVKVIKAKSKEESKPNDIINKTIKVKHNSNIKNDSDNSSSTKNQEYKIIKPLLDNRESDVSVKMDRTPPSKFKPVESSSASIKANDVTGKTEAVVTPPDESKQAETPVKHKPKAPPGAKVKVSKIKDRITPKSKFLAEVLNDEKDYRAQTSATYVVGNMSARSSPSTDRSTPSIPAPTNTGTISDTHIKVDSAEGYKTGNNSPTAAYEQQEAEGLNNYRGMHHDVDDDKAAQNELEDKVDDSKNNGEGYDNAYGYPAYTDPNYHNTDPNYHNTDPNYHNMQQQQQQQQVIDIPPNAPNPYQYQSPPHVIQDIRYNPSSNLPQQELSPRHTVKDVKQQPRKPVTQATKPKSKLPAKGKVAATTSTETSDLSSLRITLEEKEQALLASQETVQILQVKIRRLEHLLHLKDMRINELKGNPVSQEQVLMLQQHHQTSQQPQPPIHHPLPQYAQPSHQQPIPPAQKYTTQQANIPSHHPNAPMNTRPQPPAQHPNPNMNNNRNVPMQQYNYASMKFNAQPPLPGIPKTPPIDHQR